MLLVHLALGYGCSVISPCFAFRYGSSRKCGKDSLSVVRLVTFVSVLFVCFVFACMAVHFFCLDFATQTLLQNAQLILVTQ